MYGGVRVRVRVIHGVLLLRFAVSLFSNARQNQYSSSDSDSLIFTRLYCSALLNTTPTEVES